MPVSSNDITMGWKQDPDSWTFLSLDTLYI
jgi:hypothetical protein